MTEAGIARLKRNEDFSPVAYVCPAGRATIGYGVNVEAFPGLIGFRPLMLLARSGKLRGRELAESMAAVGIKWSEDHADGVLRGLVSSLEQQLSITYPWLDDISPERRDVVVEMAYQLGFAGLRSFRRFRAAMEQRDYERAAVEMTLSKWAEHDSPARAHELAAAMRGAA